MSKELVEIIDADLVEQLTQARGNPALPMIKRHLSNMQRCRNEAETKRSTMKPLERRRNKTRDLIASRELRHDERYHMHSVLALCGLPYRRPHDDQGDYIREYGRSSLVIQAGFLKDPVTGKMIRQGLPYGPKARLLMLHICTVAIRQNSREVELAESLSAFIRELGFSVTGGRKGTVNLFKDQLHRIAAARMQIGLWNGERTRTINSQPIESFDIWLPSDPDQKLLWSTTLYMNKDFFDSLKNHALPVDIRAIRSFANSAKQINIILWLAYRLRNLKRPYIISWNILHDQFGTAIARSRKFRESFIEDLKGIEEVFPRLPATLTDKGLRLTPCDPEALFVPPKKVLPSKR